MYKEWIFVSEVVACLRFKREGDTIRLLETSNSQEMDVPAGSLLAVLNKAEQLKKELYTPEELAEAKCEKDA